MARAFATAQVSPTRGVSTEVTIVGAFTECEITMYASPEGLDVSCGSRMTEVSRIADPRLRHFLRYWLRLRGDRLVPERGEFDAAEVAPVLSYFWVCQKEPETGRFRFRLAGEEIRWFLGKPVPGTYLDQLLPNITNNLEQQLEAVVSGPMLLHGFGALYRDDGYAVHGERLILPLRERGQVSVVMAATLFSLRDPNPVADTTTTFVPVSQLSLSDLALLPACRPGSRSRASYETFACH